MDCQRTAPTAERPKETCASGDASACETDCDAGVEKACDDAASIYLKNGDTGAEKAASLYKRLCDSDRRRYCPSYAFALAEGKGLAKDEARAREMFIATCEYDPTACSEYGSLCASGTGVPKDVDMAHLLLSLACKHLDAHACEDLARLLEFACGQGHGGSCNELAVLHSESVGQEPDDAAVADLFRRGCDADDAPACRNLALATMAGRGVAKDPIEAGKLYAKACQLGSKDACSKSPDKKHH